VTSESQLESQRVTSESQLESQTGLQGVTSESQDSLNGFRSKLSEAIERIERLEKFTGCIPLGSDESQPPAKITAIDSPASIQEIFTTSQLSERFGWSKTNAVRTARANGWTEAGKRGREKLWRLI
jgi:hypothetical protein